MWGFLTMALVSVPPPLYVDALGGTWNDATYVKLTWIFTYGLQVSRACDEWRVANA